MGTMSAYLHDPRAAHSSFCSEDIEFAAVVVFGPATHVVLHEHGTAAPRGIERLSVVGDESAPIYPPGLQA